MGKDTRACSVDGCDGAVAARGYCNKHYLRVKIHGDPHAVTTYAHEPDDYVEGREWQLIGLTRGKQAKVDTADYDRFARYSWQYRPRGRGGDKGYAVRAFWVGRKGEKRPFPAQMHRLIARAKPGEQVDHRSGDTLDNRRANLRVCTSAQNSWNASPIAGAESAYKGVARCRKYWRAEIKRNGTVYPLGTFETEREAALAYDYHARQLHGEFAKLNFPNEPPQLPEKRKMRNRRFEDWQVRAMRRAHEECGLSYRALGRAFATDGNTVMKIVKRKSYADVR